MTLEEAREILKTYRPPLTGTQYLLYTRALGLVSGGHLVPPPLKSGD